MCTAPIVPQHWHDTRGLADSVAVDPERCDVAVVGAGLVGLSLAYELACLGATSRWSTRPTRGGPPTPGGILARHEHRGGPAAVAVPAPGRCALPCLPGPARRGRRRHRAGRLRHLRDPSMACAPRGRLVRALRRAGPPPLAGGGVRDPGGRRGGALPALGPRPARAACTAWPASTGEAWPARCGRPRGRGRRFVEGACTASSGVFSAREVRSVGCRVGAPSTAGRWRSRAGLDGRRRRMARPRPPGRADQRADRAPRRRGGDGWLAHRAAPLTHYLVPWPGGRVACGAPSKPGPGSR